MTKDRYETIRSEEGWHLSDRKEDRIKGEPFPSSYQAERATALLNRGDTAQESILESVRAERARQDADNLGVLLPSGLHLAIAMKKIGNVAEGLTERNPQGRSLEAELVEATAVLVRWLEQLASTRKGHV